jgi:hypothetical protein
MSTSSTEEKKTRKKCDSILSYLTCAVLVFFIFTTFICLVKFLANWVIDQYNCGKQLAFVEGTQVYIQDRLENITEGFTVIEDRVKHGGTEYVILDINRYSSRNINLFYKDTTLQIKRNIEKFLENVDANQIVVTQYANLPNGFQKFNEGDGKIYVEDGSRSVAQNVEVTNAVTEVNAVSKDKAPVKGVSSTTAGKVQDSTNTYAPESNVSNLNFQNVSFNDTNDGKEINKVINDLNGADNKNKELLKLKLVEILKKSIKSLNERIKILDGFINNANVSEDRKKKYSEQKSDLQAEENEYVLYLKTYEEEFEEMRKNRGRSGDTFIAVPRSFVHRLDSLRACLIGNDPLGLFRPGEDKDGRKSEIFRKWKNGEKPDKDKKWYENLPWMADSKMSNQINYFIYKLFVPINRICCYLQQLSFNKMETLCKVFTILDEAIYIPSMFPSDAQKQHDRDMIELAKEKDGEKSENEKQIVNLKIMLFQKIYNMKSEEKSKLRTKLGDILKKPKDIDKLNSFKNLFPPQNNDKNELFYKEGELIFKAPTDGTIIKPVLEKVIEKLKESIMDPFKHVLHTFLRFSVFFLKNVTLTIFSILVHYITLLIDIIEVSFTSFLMISSGVEAQKGSVTKIFSGLVGGFSELLKNPAVLAGVGVATSGIGPVIAQGLSMTGSATAAAINANNEARMYGEQFKAQGFSNMTGFVAKNPTGVLFFTKSFIKVFFKFGIAGPFTLIHRMTETLCDYTGLSENDVDEEDELGKRAAEIMMKQLNDSIVKGTDDFNSTNKKAMNASWKGITSSANSFITGTKKYIKSLKENSVSSPQEDMSPEPEPEKIISSKKSPRKPVSRKRSNNGIDKANIISTKRVIKKPSRYGGGRKKTGRKSKKSIHYRKIH